MTKDVLFTEHLMYQGKMFKGEGKKQDGTPWKKYDVMFRKGQYGAKYSFFDPTPESSLNLDELKEGEWYEVVYKMREFTTKDGKAGKARSGILLKQSDYTKSTENDRPPHQEQKEEQSQLNPQQGNDVAPSSTAKVMPSFQKFADSYDEQMKMANKVGNPMHMLGAYIANNFKDEYNEIVSKCVEHFK